MVTTPITMSKPQQNTSKHFNGQPPRQPPRQLCPNHNKTLPRPTSSPTGRSGDLHRAGYRVPMVGRSQRSTGPLHWLRSSAPEQCCWLEERYGKGFIQLLSAEKTYVVCVLFILLIIMNPITVDCSQILKIVIYWIKCVYSVSFLILFRIYV